MKPLTCPMLQLTNIWFLPFEKKELPFNQESIKKICGSYKEIQPNKEVLIFTTPDAKVNAPGCLVTATLKNNALVCKGVERAQLIKLPANIKTSPYCQVLKLDTTTINTKIKQQTLLLITNITKFFLSKGDNSTLELLLSKKMYSELLDYIFATYFSKFDESGKFDLIRIDFLYATTLEQKLTSIKPLLDISKHTTKEAQHPSKLSQRIENLISKIDEQQSKVKQESEDTTAPDDDDDMNIYAEIEQSKCPENIKKILYDKADELGDYYGEDSESKKNWKYINFALSLPWQNSIAEKVSLASAQKILDKSHYGLKEVKQRILEYLAVRQNKPQTSSSIICLLSSPGMGKSTIAKAIAKCLGRKFIKISLGGMHDTALLKGHSFTYVGSGPGQIIKKIQASGCDNPVIVLDEIDKVFNNGQLSGGDVNAVLLEVLDSELNKNFADDYLDFEFDLSKVIFILTANYVSQIPPALVNRLEVINIDDYSLEDKLQIAQKYLIKQVLVDNGVDNKFIKFDKDALIEIIQNYTFESGVRDLKKNIEKIVRKIILQQKLHHKQQHQIIIKAADIKTYLKDDFNLNHLFKINPYPMIGRVNGLSVCGDTLGAILPIECVLYQGTGKITASGNLEKLMEETPTTALAYIKANQEQLHLPSIDFNKIDINVFYPDASKKDGNSAGVATTTAILSSLHKHPIPVDVAYTGSISATGFINAIGGLDKKLQACVRAGIKTVFIPEENVADWQKIPTKTLKSLQVYATSHYQQVYDKLFVLWNKPTCDKINHKFVKWHNKLNDKMLCKDWATSIASSTPVWWTIHNKEVQISPQEVVTKYKIKV